MGCIFFFIVNDSLGGKKFQEAFEAINSHYEAF